MVHPDAGLERPGRRFPALRQDGPQGGLVCESAKRGELTHFPQGFRSTVPVLPSTVTSWPS